MRLENRYFNQDVIFAVEEESVESGSFTMGHQSTSNRSSFNSETVVGGDYGAVKRKSTRDKKHGTGLFGFLR